MLFTHTKVLFTYENAFCICFLHAPLRFLHMTWPKCFEIGLEHTPECFLHMLFTHTKVLFTNVNAFWMCFPHAPLCFSHMTWPKCFLQRTWTHTRMLFTYDFYTHQSAFYIWECFLHMLFTRTTAAFYIQLDPSAFYIGLEHTPECFLHMLFTHTKVLFTYENAFCICFLHAPLRLFTYNFTQVLFT